MELLEGQTLAHYVRERGALPVDQALPLLQQVAAGLDAAHGYKEANGTSKPIVHRDLKPENLFMAREHGAWVVKILDFGIAKVLGETGNVSQEVRGTPLYMAFEQVTAGALSPQTDVWAFGLITYYVLTGSHYWRSASQPSANVQSLFAEILTLPLEPPSVRLRQQNVRAELPPAFDAWLLECLQRDPARRFASAGAAIDALAQALGKSPRARTRVDSKPAAGLAFASTEAYQPPRASAVKPLGTAASLPGMASERGSAPAPPRPAPSRRWLPAAGAAGMVLLGGVSWLVFGAGDAQPDRVTAGAPPAASSDAARSAANAPAPTQASVGEAPVGASQPAHDSEAQVAPVTKAPSVAPAPDDAKASAVAPFDEPTDTTPTTSADQALHAAPSVTSAEPTSNSGSDVAIGSSPQVRIAPEPTAPPEPALPATLPGAPSPAARPALPVVNPPTAPALPVVRATAEPAPSVRPAAPAPPSRATPARAPNAAPPKKPVRNSDAYKMR
jgi:serine/threonine-protein kinase